MKSDITTERRRMGRQVLVPDEKAGTQLAAADPGTGVERKRACCKETYPVGARRFVLFRLLCPIRYLFFPAILRGNGARTHRLLTTKAVILDINVMPKRHQQAVANRRALEIMIREGNAMWSQIGRGFSQG